MITVDRLTKSFGSQLLFEEVSFNVNRGERVGLVGRNGHGKTTLFKLILGELEPDSGQITKPNNYTVGHLDQHLHFRQPTVLEEGCQGLPPQHREDAWRVEKILFGLGFTREDMYRPPQEFSGGFQVRLNLAKALVAEPDLLLLDEPTNYLDVLSIRWLTRFLRAWKGELMLITHDRGFMDGVITHTLGIHRRKLRKILGGTAQYYNQIIQEEEIYEKTRLNDEKKRKEVESFINRFRAKARLAKMVQSRIKALDRQGRLAKLDHIESLDFSFNAAAFPAKVMLETRKLAFGYAADEAPLIDHLDLVVGREDRICVVGKNGKGKSTLLRLLAGELDPVMGTIQRHASLQIGYYGQTNVDRLDPTLTVEQEILAVEPGHSRQKARDIAGALMFEGDAALKKVSILSGGERARVLLGRLLVTPCHLLLLDEPTNHLDMESTDSLIAAVDNFPGSSVVVTHNEELLHALATRLVVFARERVTVFEGTYHQFLDDVGWEEEDAPRKQKGGAKAAPPLNKTEIRRLRKDLQEQKAQVIKPARDGIAAAEAAILKAEAEIKANLERIATASAAGNGKQIADLSRRNHELETLIEKSFAEMERLSQLVDRESEDLKTKLAALGE